jgi:hypothetical protein
MTIFVEILCSIKAFSFKFCPGRQEPAQQNPRVGHFDLLAMFSQNIYNSFMPY